MIRRVLIWAAAMAAVAAVTAMGRLIDLNATTVGFAFLIVVLLASLRGGLLVGTAYIARSSVSLPRAMSSGSLSVSWPGCTLMPSSSVAASNV